MLKTIVGLSVFLIATLLSTSSVLANFEFSTGQTSITDTDELIVDVTIDLSSSTANNIYYLRGAFYKEGTTQYFGYTLNNNGDSYNGPFSNDSCHDLYQITVNSTGDWTGQIKAKIDTSDNSFTGSGNYLFKVSRYTESCSNTWADTDPITIGVTQTVFNSPTPSPSSSTGTSKSPTPTPANSPKSSTKTTKTSPSPTPKVLAASQKTAEFQSTPSTQIEDSIAKVDPNQFNLPSPPPESQQPSKKVAGILVSSGAVLIGISIAGFLFFKRQENVPTIQKEKNRF